MTRLFAASLAVTSATSGFACAASTPPHVAEGPLAMGDRVPALSANDHRGEAVELRAMSGRTFVVYFYPRDGTPGCTKEACAFRDAWARYQQAGVDVIGVSTDSVASHREFATTHELPFSLISDREQRWSNAFGVRSTLGMTARVSFLVGPDGRIARVYPDVDPGVHAREILDDAAKLGPSAAD